MMDVPFSFYLLLPFVNELAMHTIFQKSVPGKQRAASG